MASQNGFRLLLLAAVVLTILEGAAIALTAGTLPSPLREYAIGNDGHPVLAIHIVSLMVGVASFVAIIGLFLFRAAARPLFGLSLAAGILITPALGPVVESGWVLAISTGTNILLGFVLAVAYLPPVDGLMRAAPGFAVGAASSSLASGVLKWGGLAFLATCLVGTALLGVQLVRSAAVTQFPRTETTRSELSQQTIRHWESLARVRTDVIAFGRIEQTGESGFEQTLHFSRSMRSRYDKIGDQIREMPIAGTDPAIVDYALRFADWCKQTALLWQHVELTVLAAQNYKENYLSVAGVVDFLARAATGDPTGHFQDSKAASGDIQAAYDRLQSATLELERGFEELESERARIRAALIQRTGDPLL